MSSHAIDCHLCIQAADHHMYASRSIYRLLVLLSIFPMFMATVCLALAPDTFIEKSGSQFLSDNSIAQYSVKRQYKLYNHCSSQQVLIIGGSVNALGSQDNPNTILTLQSAHYKNSHGIQIISRGGRFLCFSKKSKLITKFSGANPRCIFEELFSPDFYTELRSIYNKDWLVGFNRRGKPILGSETKKAHRSRCYHFTKRDNSYLDALHKTRHYAPKISNPHKLMHLLHEQRARRQKRQTFREMRR